jgi:hypothetical protein
MQMSVIRPAADISIDVYAWPLSGGGHAWLGWFFAGVVALVAAAML